MKCIFAVKKAKHLATSYFFPAQRLGGAISNNELTYLLAKIGADTAENEHTSARMLLVLGCEVEHDTPRSLVNCCTIDWFTPWPPAALEAVAEQQLRDLAMPVQVRK